MNKRFYLHLIIIGLFLALALLLTWPLAAHLTTHLPGEPTWAFDESTFAWNMWWFKFSLLNLSQTPLHSNYTFFPLGINLTTYTFNLLNAALGLPLQLALSLPLASNLTLLFSFVSSAYGMFLLSLYLLRPRISPLFPLLSPAYLAAFAAGAGFSFSASRMMYAALGHYNFATIQWFPFYTLFLLKTLRQGKLIHILLTALCAAFCLYTELTYSVFLIFITLLVIAGEFKTLKVLKTLRALTLIALLALLLTAPFILAVLPDFLNPAYAEPGWGEGLKLSADLAGLFTLTPLHPLSGVNWLNELQAVIKGAGRFSDVNTLFLGYGLLALALLGFIARRRAGRRWLWGVIIFTLLSLGPLLTINGRHLFNLDGLEVTFPMPFTLLHYLPVISAHRVPNRFGIPLTMCMAVLVGYGVNWLLCRVSRFKDQVASSKYQVSAIKSHVLRITYNVLRNTQYAIFILLLFVLLFDQYSVPLPLSNAQIPQLYTQIGAEPDNFTLLQLPLGWRNSYGTVGAEQTQLQYYQAAHHRPILAGNTSRNPAFKFDYYRRIPLFAALTNAELGYPVDETILQKGSRQAADLMTLYNVKYLIIHDPVPGRAPYETAYPATRQLALDLIPHQTNPVYTEPGAQAFAVIQPPIPDPLILDFGDWLSDPYRGEGWADNETIFAATANWATSVEALIFFPARGPGDRRLSIRIAPFSYPNMPPQTVRLLLNGWQLVDNFSLREEWQTIETTLPTAYLLPGLNRLTLRFNHTAQPRQVIPANRAIGHTGLDTPVDIEVNSSADFAYVTVGFGKEAVDASAHRRDINLAVLEPKTGQLVTLKGFDTAANEFESAALRQFIAAIPQGYIVVVATQGTEALAYVNSDTRAALTSLGLTTDGLTSPLAAIGVKGAAPGAALQITGSDQNSAYLRLGANPDTRTLAAAVDKVIISGP